MLNDSAVEYEDGTPATESQIVTFLSWAPEPEMEERKLVSKNTILPLSIISTLFFFRITHCNEKITQQSGDVLENIHMRTSIFLKLELMVGLFLCNWKFLLMGFKWTFVLSLALLQAAYHRRLKWPVLGSRNLLLDVN